MDMELFKFSAPNNSSSFILSGQDFPATGLTNPSKSTEAGPLSLHIQGCSCTSCARLPEDPTKVIWSIRDAQASSTNYGTIQELSNYLRSGYWTASGSSPRKWNLGTTGTGAKNGTLTVNMTGATDWQGEGVTDSNGISDARKAVARAAFEVYEQLLGIDFVETTDNNADILFTDNVFGDGGANSAFSGSWTYNSTGDIAYNRINVTPGWYGGSNDVNGDYVLQTFIHEIGHSLGLGHQGNYNGTGDFSTEAVFANDSWDMSIMSYFSQSTNPNTSASYSFIPVLMSADVIALDDLYRTYGYGINNSFTGNTIYGFNTNISSSTSSAWNAMSSLLSVDSSTWGSSFTITDGGGTDTIDLSGYSSNQSLNLQAAAKTDTTLIASTVGDYSLNKQNLFIAPGTVIENASGGSGDDEITGNTADNSIKGNAGNDTLSGSTGSDTLEGGSGNDLIDGGLLGIDIAVFSGVLSDYSFTGSSRIGRYTAVDLRSGSTDGTDTLVDIERVRFAGSGEEVPISQLINGGITTIESKGSVELQKDSSGLIYAKPSNGSSDDITASGQHVGVNTYAGWSPVAAETISGQNKVIWTHSNGTMAEWNLDSSWSWSNSVVHAAGSAGFLGVESAFQMDFNNDGVIG